MDEGIDIYIDRVSSTNKQPALVSSGSESQWFYQVKQDAVNSSHSK